MRSLYKTESLVKPYTLISLFSVTVKISTSWMYNLCDSILMFLSQILIDCSTNSQTLPWPAEVYLPLNTCGTMSSERAVVLWYWIQTACGFQSRDYNSQRANRSPSSASTNLTSGSIETLWGLSLESSIRQVSDLFEYIIIIKAIFRALLFWLCVLLLDFCLILFWDRFFLVWPWVASSFSSSWASPGFPWWSTR